MMKTNMKRQRFCTKDYWLRLESRS